eukprot:TRINITY_DN7143_c0_g1_i1.p1 TRINITY_DN7143_c0_g1~~TRINITY_DN7143_c0_g1_i1.p1  ORF type:complete len:886 (+),score=120.54 TRINITY_DN7143_c0_g1_i1:39-2696(+)
MPLLKSLGLSGRNFGGIELEKVKSQEYATPLFTLYNGVYEGKDVTILSSKKEGSPDKVTSQKGEEHYDTLTSLVKDSLYSSTSQRKKLVGEALGRLRTLRHPGVLKYIKSATKGVGGSTTVTIVTERAQTLRQRLAEVQEITTEEICMGISNVANALQWLHEECGIAYNNVTLDGIFVTQAPVRWLLGDFSFCCHRDAADVCQQSMQHLPIISPEDVFGVPIPARQRLDRSAPLDLCQRDVYCTAALVDTLLTSSTTPPSSLLGHLKSIVTVPFNTEILQQTTSQYTTKSDGSQSDQNFSLVIPTSLCVGGATTLGDTSRLHELCHSGYVVRCDGVMVADSMQLRQLLQDALSRGQKTVLLHYEVATSQSTFCSPLNSSIASPCYSSDSDDGLPSKTLSERFSDAENRGISAVLGELSDEIQWCDIMKLPDQINLVATDSAAIYAALTGSEPTTTQDQMQLWALSALDRCPYSRPTLAQLLGGLSDSVVARSTRFLRQRFLLAHPSEKRAEFKAIAQSIRKISYSDLIHCLLPLLLNVDVLSDPESSVVFNEVFRVPSCYVDGDVDFTCGSDLKNGSFSFPTPTETSKAALLGRRRASAPAIGNLPEPVNSKDLLRKKEFSSKVMPFIMSCFEDSTNGALRCALIRHLPSYYPALTKQSISTVVEAVSVTLYDSNDEITVAGCAACPTLVDAAMRFVKGAKDTKLSEAKIQKKIVFPLHSLAVHATSSDKVACAAVIALKDMWSSTGGQQLQSLRGSILSALTVVLKSDRVQVTKELIKSMQSLIGTISPSDAAGILLPVLGHPARKGSPEVRSEAQSLKRSLLHWLSTENMITNDAELPTPDGLASFVSETPINRNPHFRSAHSGWDVIALAVKKTRSNRSLAV